MLDIEQISLGLKFNIIKKKNIKKIYGHIGEKKSFRRKRER